MGTVAVEFAPNALNAIKADVIHGFKSIPRRGAEVGGLLCGTIVETAPVARVRIESVIPVVAEHRFGPAYRLSTLDRQNFRKAMEDWAPLGIVGWYRSHTRPGTAPDEQDRSFTAEFFPERPSALLICYPDASLNVPGDMCLWTAGRQEASTHVEMGRYSLLDEALTSAERPESPDLVPMSPPEPNVPEPRNPEVREWHPSAAAPVPPLPEAEPLETSSRNGRFALFGTLALAISFGAYLVHARLKPATASASQVRPAGLGMKVDRQGNELLVSWNREAPEILQAANADFKIMEGTRSRVLALSSHELRTGSLLYTANAEDIEMELDVSGPAGDFAESVRVVGGSPGTTLVATPILPAIVPAIPPAVLPPASSLGEATPVSTRSGSDSIRFVTGPPEATRSQTVARPAPSPASPAASPRAFVPPPRRGIVESRPLSAAPDAPVLQTALNPPPALPIGISNLASRSLPSQNLQQGNASPVRIPENDIDTTPPRAIRSVQPSFGPASTAMERAFAQTDKPHQVQVEVSIDERGAVTSAAVGATTGPFAYLFVDSALAAARRWQFEPAKRGGRPVPGKATLKFEFVKTGR